MPEYIKSVCRSCFHSYVCEQFNAHRDSYNEKCHFFNDHFAPAADVVAVETVKAWLYAIAMNNVGVKADDVASVCEDIAERMDGLRAFEKERRGEE